jgi:hypothetical protein
MEVISLGRDVDESFSQSGVYILQARVGVVWESRSWAVFAVGEIE